MNTFSIDIAVSIVTKLIVHIYCREGYSKSVVIVYSGRGGRRGKKPNRLENNIVSLAGTAMVSMMFFTATEA